MLKVTLRAVYWEGKLQHLCLLTAALYLNLKVKNATCSSVTISWTSEDNRTADFRILYNSTVHSGDKNFKKDASPPHTTKLTDLVADTEYNITVIAKYDDDNMTVRDTISASTKSGTPSEKGTLYYDCRLISMHCTYTKHKK